MWLSGGDRLQKPDASVWKTGLPLLGPREREPLWSPVHLGPASQEWEGTNQPQAPRGPSEQERVPRAHPPEGPPTPARTPVPLRRGLTEDGRAGRARGSGASP